MKFKYSNPVFWHDLYQSLQNADPLERQQALDGIAHLPIDNDDGRLLQETFLSEFSDSQDHIRRAGLLAVSSDKLSLDCLCAHAALHCIRALRLGDRQGFIDSIRNAQLPQVISKLNAIALSTVKNSMIMQGPASLERIAIVVSYFGNTFHSPSRLASSYAHAFKALGINANIYSCQELLPANMQNYHGAGRRVKLPKVDGLGWAGRLPVTSTLFVADEAETMSARWGSAVKKISEFNPDLILSIGPYSFLSSALYSIKPVIALPTNTVSFMGNADVWLKGTDIHLSNIEISWSKQFPMPLLAVHPYRIQKPKQGKVISRSDLGISPHAVILVTVGFRLQSEIEGHWAKQMLAYVLKEESVVWLLIGDETPPALEDAPAGKVINLGPRDGVVDLLSVSDLYVNPPRMGGGFSVLEAMGIGLPVLAFRNTDGGEKVGKFGVQDDQSFFRQLEELVVDPKKRCAVGAELKARFHSLYDMDQSGPSLLDACNVAIEHARKRLKYVS